MPRYAAFLRAINVGGHVVKMERLRALLEAVGLTDVRTLIASGNVLFTATARSATALEARIERHLRDALGYDVLTFVRSKPQLDAIVALEPFGAHDGTVLVTFHKDAPNADATRKLLAHATDTDAFHVHGHESYWGGGARMSESPFFKLGMEKVLGIPGTGRNMNTVRKIADAM